MHDQRLEEIHNKKTSGGPTLSRFNYEYDPAGQITTWSQQQGDYPLVYKLGYDQAGQLVSARAGLGKSAPPYVHQYGYSYDPGANRTSAFKSTGNVAKISGSVTTSDVVSIIVNDASLPGGTKQIDYTVQGGDTLADIARNLSAAITSDSDMQSSHINAFAVMAADSPSTIGAQIFLRSTSNEPTVFKGDTSGGATESIELGYMFNGTTNAIVGGTATPSDVVTITIFDASLPSNPTSENYTVQGGDTLDDIATGLATAINSNTDFQTAGITAQTHLNVLNIQSRSTTITNVDSSFSGGATETLDIKPNINGTQTAIIGGSVTSSDVLTITIKDAGLSGGSISVNYTVQPGDSTSVIAAGLASAINASTPLQDLGITGESVDSVLNIASISTNLTTVLSSLSGGATETIALAPSLNISEFGHNNLNELNSIATGGITTFEGKTNKAVTGVTVDSNDAELLDTKHFSGNASLSSGANNIAIVATDAQPANKTENQIVHATGPASATPTFDANGNMTFDGTNTYVWDAENKLIRIDYPGIGNSSEFVFDAFGKNTKTVERVSSVQTSTKQFIWCGDDRCEERDDLSAVKNRYFFYGQLNQSSASFYCFDHLESVTELLDGNGDFQAVYSYTPSGEVREIIGIFNADFGYHKYYFHRRANLNLPVFRSYSPRLNRFINRDPIEEAGGINLYDFVGNNAVSSKDPSGLKVCLMQGHTQAALSVFNPTFWLHRTICIDSWSCDCKQKTGRKSFSYRLEPSYLDIMGMSLPIVFGAGFYEETQNVSFLTVKCRETTCAEDKALIKKFENQIQNQMRGPYGFHNNSSTVPTAIYNGTSLPAQAAPILGN